MVVKVGRRVIPGPGPGAVRGPSDRALDRLVGRFAIGLRLGSAVASAVAGPLAAANGIARSDLALVLAALWAWSVFFVAAVARRGLTWPLVLADAAVIMAIVAMQRYVVPAPFIADGTTWMLPLASTAVYIPALALSPWLSLPTAGAVTAVYVLTVPHPGDAAFLIFQALVTAALMTLVRRGGRSADAVIAGYLRAGQAARAEAARRADEREQYRRVHDTALSTLTMVASGAFSAPLTTLRAQAAHDLQVLQALPGIPGGTTSRSWWWSRDGIWPGPGASCWPIWLATVQPRCRWPAGWRWPGWSRRVRSCCCAAEPAGGPPGRWRPWLC